MRPLHVRRRTRTRTIAVLDDSPLIQQWVKQSVMPEARRVSALRPTELETALEKRVKGLDTRRQRILNYLKRSGVPKGKARLLRHRAEDLRQRMKRSPFDALVCDVKMPVSIRQIARIEEIVSEMQEANRTRNQALVDYLKDEAMRLMPAIGFRVAENMRRRYPQMPIILHSDFGYLDKTKEFRIKRFLKEHRDIQVSKKDDFVGGINLRAILLIQMGFAAPPEPVPVLRRKAMALALQETRVRVPLESLPRDVHPMVQRYLRARGANIAYYERSLTSAQVLRLLTAEQVLMIMAAKRQQ